MTTDDNLSDLPPTVDGPTVDGQHPEDLQEQVLADCINRLNRGETLRPELILAAYPTIGPEVLEQLEAFRGFGSNEPNEPLGALGDYTLRRQIARGGMGVVYEAWQGSLDRQVALKVLPPGIAADTRAFTRFMREAKTAAQLSHPNVVGVHSVGLEKDTPYYAMEYVEGETLAQLLARIKGTEPAAATPFGAKGDVAYFHNLAKAFADVADGLQHAHSKSVVHRDIKPSNLILDGEGKLRILDFGLARLEGQESLTLSGDLMGTVLYMSPEQAMAKRIPLDHRTDVYSLGATMYEALAGQPPFKGKDQHDTLSQIIVRDPRPPRQFNPGVPVDLETITLKCLRKDPADRYGTAEALAQDLGRFARGDPVEAKPEAAWERLARGLRKYRKLLAAVGVALLLLAFSGWQIHQRGQAEYEKNLEKYESTVLSAIDKIREGELSLWTGRREPGRRENRIGFGTGGELLGAPLSTRSKTGWTTERTRRINEAIEELEEVTTTLLEARDAHYFLALAYTIVGRHDDARREIDGTPELREFPPASVLRWELAAGEKALAFEDGDDRVFDQRVSGYGWSGGDQQAGHTKELQDGENSMFLFRRSGSRPLLLDTIVWTDSPSYTPSDEDYLGARSTGASVDGQPGPAAGRRSKVSHVGGGVQIWLEAEHFTERIPDRQDSFRLRRRTPGAINRIVKVEGDAEGCVRWDFDIREAGGQAGTWYMWARVQNPEPDGSSFCMLVNGDPGDPSTPDTVEYRGGGIRGLEEIAAKYETRSEWEKEWLVAYRSMRDGEWSRATEAYTRLLEEADEPYLGFFTEVHLGRGVARLEEARLAPRKARGTAEELHSEQRYYAKAREDFVAAGARARSFLEPDLLYAKACYLGGEAGEAERHLGWLYDTARDDRESEVAFLIAMVYYPLEYEKALEWAKRMGEHPLGPQLRSFLHFLLDQTQAAIEAGREAVRVNPGDPKAHIGLARALLMDLWSGPSPDREQKVAELLDATERALELDPIHERARELRANAVAERDRHRVQTLEVHPAGRDDRVLRGFFDDVREVPGVVNTPQWELAPELSQSGLELYFSRMGKGQPDLCVARRDAPDEAFLDVTLLDGVNTPESEEDPKLSGDGLRLYFTQCRVFDSRVHREPGCEIYVATRETLDDEFGDPQPVEELNSPLNDQCADVSGDGRVIVFSRGERDWRDLYIASRESRDARFCEPRSLTEINSDYDDAYPSISGDGLTIFWSDGPESHRKGGSGRMDLWMATRSELGERFGEPVNLGFPVNTPFWDTTPSVSDGWPASGSVLYFVRSPLQPDLYRATWHLDCNGNGVDDLEEIDSGDAADADSNDIPDECERGAR